MRLARLIRRTARDIAEVAAIVDGGVRARRVEKRTDFSRCPNPVLLLHGFFTSRRTFDVLERRLRRDGYGVFTLDLGGLAGALNTRGIDDLADYVRAKIERIYARNPGLGPLTVVGHSKGGLIAAYYVKKLGGWRRTQAVVTLGTPHNGTPVAYLGLPVGFFARSLWQLFPGSPFLRRLSEGPWPAEVRLVSIWSREDGAAPFPSAVLDTHDLPHLANVEVSATHGRFLTSKRVYQAVLNELRTAEERTPIRHSPLTSLAGGKARAASGTRAASGGESAPRAASAAGPVTAP